MRPLNQLDQPCLNALKTALDGYQRFETTSEVVTYFQKIVTALVGPITDLNIWAIRDHINREDERRSRITTVKVRVDVSDQLLRLGQQELRVLKLIGEGHGSEDIAGLLSISYRTVANHKASITQKLGLGSAKSLIKFAIDNLSFL